MDLDILSRRQFLGSGLAAGAIGLTGSLPVTASEWEDYSAGLADSMGIPPGRLAPDDEAAWRQIAKNYPVTPKITNLENGYWGIMATPVLAEYKRLTEFINRDNTVFARLQYAETYRGLREAVAKFLNVGVDEVALTRGATEGLQALIAGYNKLKPGDTVLYADLDYSEMKTAMRWLAERRGVNPVRVAFPEPTYGSPLTEAQVLAFYEKALSDNPGTRLLLLTHLNNITGLIIPVAKIAKMARDRGVDVILDAAHSVGQAVSDLKELGCPFIGANLHKWIGAPIGCGFIYVDKSRIADIDTFMSKAPGSTSVTDRLDIGTANFAAHMAIPAAIAFHSKIGLEAKKARLQHLRDQWVGPSRKLKGLTILTPDDKTMYGSLTSFRLDGVTTPAANAALAKHLREKYGILTVPRGGAAAGGCIRVTVSVYNTPADVMKLATALREITRTPRTWLQS
jgi:isopenicillin-N epimerase